MRHLLCLSTAVLGMSLSLSLLAADGLSVEGGWTRATPPGAVNSASYVTVLNDGDKPREIVAAHTDSATEVQIHTVINDNGLMKMRRVELVEVPAGGMAELKPGGFHIMMLGVVAPLREGEDIKIELEFADGERIEFVSPIQKMAVMKGMDHSKMDHSEMKQD